MQDRIVYEDNHILVINKLPSEIVQGDKTGDVPLTEKVKEFIKVRDHKPGNVFCGLTHRLDRPVSGLIIFAKTSKALSRFNEIFRNKDIKKKYLAVTANKPPLQSDKLIHWLKKNEKSNTSIVYSKETTDGLRAELDYEHLHSSDHYHLLLISLHTGRHHQIRAQLASLNCPIKGDVKYGAKRGNDGGFIHLHSYELTFMHPIKKEPIHLTCLPAFSDPVWDFFHQKMI
ncbi:MAG: RNA pseudouridine synthase [Sphingobacteriaceae bacterium]|nr:RNA pseudouridine synthase [Sphingobacteriaceae bacterium]